MTNRDPRIPTPFDPNSGPVILLDMDGVCVNFVKGMCEAAGRDYDMVRGNWPKGEYDVCEVLDVPPDDIWSVVDAQGQDFWSQLDPHPWFSKLYSLLCAHGEVFFATAPSWTPSSFSGKISWLQDRFGREFRNYVFTPHKTLLARPGSILIDDSGEHVASFVQAGGEGILFPQPWNDAPEPEDKVDYILKEVAIIADRIGKEKHVGENPPTPTARPVQESRQKR